MCRAIDSDEESTRILFITGVLGGFTTFSTFAPDALYLFRDHRLTYAIAYVLLTHVGGLVLALNGFRMIRAIWEDS